MVFLRCIIAFFLVNEASLISFPFPSTRARHFSRGEMAIDFFATWYPCNFSFLFCHVCFFCSKWKQQIPYPTCQPCDPAALSKLSPLSNSQVAHPSYCRSPCPVKSRASPSHFINHNPFALYWHTHRSLFYLHIQTILTFPSFYS